MNQPDWLAARFEQNRPRLRAIAYRMLGSGSEADDAVQETWLRLSRADANRIDDLRGWLTTALGRTCIDMLRTRTRRRESTFATLGPETLGMWKDGTDVEEAVLLADAVGLALVAVLDTLSPHERLALVLHDVFAVPFDEVASIIGCTPAAARKLASRARIRVRGAPTDASDVARQRSIVTAFLAAANAGDFDALIRLLDPDVTFDADAAARRNQAPSGLRGAEAVAQSLVGRANGLRAVRVDDGVGIAAIHDGRPRGVVLLTFAEGRILEMYLVGDPGRLDELDLEVLEG